MKFGKRLKKQVEESLPEWRDKFLAYKRLKRLVRLVPADPSSAPRRRRAAEAVFLRLLDGEVDRFNAFFLEREEDFVIRHRELKEAVKKAAAAAEMRRVRREVVDLHGEMVLLLNYSAVNYTGLAKILKKYDKRTGRLLRLPFIEKVLGQPFFATELISGLVRECEATMEAVFHQAGAGRSGAGTTTTPRRRGRGRGGGLRAGHLPQHRRRAGDHGRDPQRELHVRALLAAADGLAGVRAPAVH